MGYLYSSVSGPGTGPHRPQFLFEGPGLNFYLTAAALNLYLLFPALNLYLPTLAN